MDSNVLTISQAETCMASSNHGAMEAEGRGPWELAACQHHPKYEYHIHGETPFLMIKAESDEISSKAFLWTPMFV